MIQAAMYFALGLLTAGLFALVVTPAIWRRATRLTRQRIERSVPMTLAEIEADKDQLRAEYAMATRRLEMNADRLREKTTEQVIEINKKRAEIVRLSNERSDQAETIRTLEQTLAGLDVNHKTTVENLLVAREVIARRETELAERVATIAHLDARIAAADQLTAEQKLELAANVTEIGNLGDRLADTTATLATITAERDRLAASLVAEQAALAAERRRSENLEASLARIEAERIDRLAELERRATEARDLSNELARGRARAEDLAARIAELEADRAERANMPPHRRDEQVPGLAANGGMRATAERVFELEAERDGWLAELDGRDTEIGLLKNELAALAAVSNLGAPADGDNIAKAIAAAEAEKAELAERLTQIEADNAGLRAENAGLRSLAGSDWDIERENAVLRERLGKVASDVVRLTQAFADGETHIAIASDNGNGRGADEYPRAVPLPAQRPTAGATAPAAAGEAAQPVESKTLAERLRALQHTAARH